jgi:hypothetical protein
MCRKLEDVLNLREGEHSKQICTLTSTFVAEKRPFTIPCNGYVGSGFHTANPFEDSALRFQSSSGGSLLEKGRGIHLDRYTCLRFGLVATNAYRFFGFRVEMGHKFF